MDAGVAWLFDTLRDAAAAEATRNRRTPPIKCG
jgi:hypothetical protein